MIDKANIEDFVGSKVLIKKRENDKIFSLVGELTEISENSIILEHPKFGKSVIALEAIDSVSRDLKGD